MPKMAGYSNSNSGSGVAPGKMSKGAGMRGNSAGKYPPKSAKAAVKPAGAKGGSMHKKR